MNFDSGIARVVQVIDAAGVAAPNPMMSAHRPQPSSTEEGTATAAAISSPTPTSPRVA